MTVSWLILVILAVLAVLSLAGPPLEQLIDRIRPLVRHRPVPGDRQAGDGVTK